MLTLGMLLVFGLVVGLVFLVIKVLVALFLIPLKIGFGLLKLLAFILVGIPLLVLGLAVAAVAVPVLVLGLPILFIGALIAAPFAIAKRL